MRACVTHGRWLIGGRVFGSMIQRVIELNDHALRFNRVGDIDHGLVEIVQGFGQVSFAVTWHAVNQKRFAGIHRRTDLIQDLVGYHHVLVAIFQHVHVQPRIPLFLTPNDVHVLEEGYGGLSAVCAGFNIFPRQSAARIGQFKP